MPRSSHRDVGITGIALSATAGFAAGLLGGMIAGEWFGDVRGERLRGLTRRFRRRRPAPPLEPAEVQAAVTGALKANPATGPLDIEVLAPGAGLIELTGRVPSAVARRAAGDVARAVPGAEVVVNRLLVEGDDIPPQNRTG